MADDLPRLPIGPSIYDHICANLDPAGRLGESGLTLPDEQDVTSGGLRWSAGALDGTLGHHAGGDLSVDRAASVAELFTKASTRPSKRNLRHLYDALSGDGVLALVDPLISKLVERQPDRAALHRLGRWLATTASDRGAVKVGIAILGLTGVATDIGVVRALGAHEEFTLYAAVALANGLPQPDSELWALASAVNGWGRIHCVERLRGTDDPEIRRWILREGFRNSIMYEYLAYTAATTGGLLDALQAQEVDRELLTAAGEIFEALVMGGPAENLDDYESGADAVEAYLALMGTRAETLGDFHAITAVRSYLSEETDWELRSSAGWTARRCEVFKAACDEILQRDVWVDRIAVGLLSDDPAEFWRAEQAAQRCGLDTFDIHVQRIEADPLGGPWFQAWQQADDERGERLAELARTRLPLDAIASGPAEELGFGPEWRSHIALDWTLQALRGHAGVGPDLVLIGLQSPVVRNRNMSLSVLKAWPSTAWPNGARQLAQRLAESDPNDRAQEFAAEVLRGESG